MVQVSPAPRALPASMERRLLAIRDQMLVDAQASIKRFAKPLRARADKLMEQVWEHRADPKQCRRLIKGFWQVGREPLYDAVADNVMDAVLYAQRYEEALIDFKVRFRHKLPDMPRPGEMKLIGDYETYYRLNYARPGAMAAMAYSYRQAENRIQKRGIHAEYERARRQRSRGRLQDAAARKAEFDKYGRAPKPITTGDELLRKYTKEGKIRPFKGTENLSAKLHGTAVAEGREASRVILRSIREAETVDRAARDLQRLLKREGKLLAQNAQQPKLIQKLVESGRALARNTGNPNLWREWGELQVKLYDYQAKLAAGGTVQNAYLELLQTVNSPEFQMKHIKGAVERWSYYKQRYQAERIIKTEQATAYRIEQLEKRKAHPWIVGYLWMMAKGLHRAFTKRRPGKRKKLGGKHCICEVMHGQTLSPATAQEYPAGGHPHCNCSLLPQYSEERLLDSDITPEEEQWWRETQGDRD